MAWIERCLNSLLYSTYPTNIVVIDNASADATVSFIRQRFSSAKVIESKINLGFGQANNAGIRLAIKENADFVFLLNQDAFVKPDTIEKLINQQLQHPSFGIISPLHFNGTGTTLDENFLNYMLGLDLKEFVVSAIIKQPICPLLIETSFVNAAAWLISAACLQKTGGFDPIFFHYGEDRNFSQRALYKGFKIGIYTGTGIFHDREERPSDDMTNVRVRIKRNWVEYLNHFSNIKNKYYRVAIIKKAMLHGALLLKALFFFRRAIISYNYEMVKKIIFSFNSISKSRRISLSDKSFPHL